MRLTLQNLSCGYTRKPVLSGIDLTVDAGEFVCLLGPNGSGKTALLKTLAGVLLPLAGRMSLDGRSWGEWSARDRAGRLAYVPQAHAPVFAFKVIDLVAMGRTARWPLWSGPTEVDWQAAVRALVMVVMEAFADRLYTELSGGERQMVLIARALAQEARFLVLDEPASSLDFGNQVRMLQTLRRLVRGGMGVLMATHHPEHALRCATIVAVVGEGRIQQLGPPAEVLTAEHLQEAYRVPFLVSTVFDHNCQPIRICVPHID